MLCGGDPSQTETHRMPFSAIVSQSTQPNISKISETVPGGDGKRSGSDLH